MGNINMLEITTSSAEETAAAGKKLGGLLKPGDILCLTGDLGAGKTAFTGGVARALGINGYITSPTFTIINEYKGELPLYHFDVYRLGDSSEMDELGFEEYISGDGVVVIEWADLIDDMLPAEKITVEIKKDLKAGPDIRRIMINFQGERYKAFEDRMSGVDIT